MANAAAFERGGVDDLTLTGPDIGEINKVVLGHDARGMGSDWHVSLVEILHAGMWSHSTVYQQITSW